MVHTGEIFANVIPDWGHCLKEKGAADHLAKQIYLTIPCAWARRPRIGGLSKEAWTRNQLMFVYLKELQYALRRWRLESCL